MNSDISTNLDQYSGLFIKLKRKNLSLNYSRHFIRMMNIFFLLVVLMVLRELLNIMDLVIGFCLIISRAWDIVKTSTV